MAQRWASTKPESEQCRDLDIFFQRDIYPDTAGESRYSYGPLQNDIYRGLLRSKDPMIRFSVLVRLRPYQILYLGDDERSCDSLEQDILEIAKDELQAAASRKLALLLLSECDDDQLRTASVTYLREVQRGGPEELRPWAQSGFWKFAGLRKLGELRHQKLLMALNGDSALVPAADPFWTSELRLPEVVPDAKGFFSRMTSYLAGWWPF